LTTASPPAEKATACEDQARQASARDGARDCAVMLMLRLDIKPSNRKVKATVQCGVGKENLPDELIWVLHGKVRTVGVTELLPDLTYDVCVLTGDYRGATFGPFDATLDGLARIRSQLKDPVYGVLGNHDAIRMVPGLEEMGIRMLLNECEHILRGDQAIYLAGIDDAHYYRVDSIEKAASEIPDNGFSILLSHTPEIYQQAAHGGFDLFVSGHTHGGQICLPGSIPITLDSVLPRHMGSGPWKYRDMVGYTSVGVGTSIVPIRLNCLPEITLHHLQCSV
jgi:uncharacterized protein